MEEKKYCKFCGEQIEKSNIVCPKCGRQIELVKEEQKNEVVTEETLEAKQEKFYEKEWFMWLMLTLFTPVGIVLMFKFNKKMNMTLKIILAITFGLLFLIITFAQSDEEYDDSIDDTNSIVETDKNKKNHYSANETFKFDDLEIKIGSNYTFTKVNNKYSDYHNKEVVKIPMTIKNLKDDTHSLNMFYYTTFGSEGTEVKNVGTYFDDNIELAGDLRSGASYTKYLYVLYDGNGTYAIEFNNFFEEKTVEFEIKK